jgi:hypothetical protein
MVFQPQQYPFSTAITAHTGMHYCPLLAPPSPQPWYGTGLAIPIFCLEDSYKRGLCHLCVFHGWCSSSNMVTFHAPGTWYQSLMAALYPARFLCASPWRSVNLQILSAWPFHIMCCFQQEDPVPVLTGARTKPARHTQAHGKQMPFLTSFSYMTFYICICVPRFPFSLQQCS